MDIELKDRIEAAILNADAMPPEIHRACADAMRLAVPAIWVNGAWVKSVATMFRASSGVATCAAISFPGGASKSTVKAIEATSCIKDGADEIAVVPHWPNVARGDVDAMKLELLEIVRAARAARSDVVVKVVVHPRSRDAINFEAACRAIRESGCDWLVISGEGSLVEIVGSAKQHAGELHVGVLATVADVASARDLIEAGASRIATAQFASVLEA